MNQHKQSLQTTYSYFIEAFGFKFNFMISNLDLRKYVRSYVLECFSICYVSCWRVPFADCGELTLDNGSITYSDSLRIGSTASYECDACHKLNNSVSMQTCTSEGWSGASNGKSIRSWHGILSHPPHYWPYCSSSINRSGLCVLVKQKALI